MCDYRIKCPSCDASLIAKPKIAGRTLACPKCNSDFMVPSPPETGVTPKVETVNPRPATEKQKAFARELGVIVPEDIDRQTISALIDEAITKRDSERFDRLNELQEKESLAREELRAEVLAECDEVDPRLSIATTEQIMDGLSQRDIGAVLITFEYGTLGGVEDMVGEKISLSFTDDIDEDDARTIVTWLGAALTLRKQRREAT